MSKKYIDSEHFKTRVLNAAVTSKNPDLCELAKAICEMVDSEQSADVAPVLHGEWVEGLNLNCELVRDCSLCGERYKPEYEDDEPYSFCPNCGAKMDGGER